MDQNQMTQYQEKEQKQERSKHVINQTKFKKQELGTKIKELGT